MAGINDKKLEYWNNGTMGKEKQKPFLFSPFFRSFLLTQYSSIPLFVSI
jgi:hypothetical protein